MLISTAEQKAAENLKLKCCCRVAEGLTFVFRTTLKHNASYLLPKGVFQWQMSLLFPMELSMSYHNPTGQQ